MILSTFAILFDVMTAPHCLLAVMTAPHCLLAVMTAPHCLLAVMTAPHCLLAVTVSFAVVLLCVTSQLCTLPLVHLVRVSGFPSTSSLMWWAQM